MFVLAPFVVGLAAGKIGGGTGSSCPCGTPCLLPWDGTGTCGADGVTCGTAVVDCSAVATAATTAAAASSTACTVCTGVQSMMPNSLCSDGSLAGPVCEAPSCAWTVRSCPTSPPSSVTSYYDSYQ